MKKLFLLLAVGIISTAAYSQKVAINAYGAYVFDDSFDVTSGANYYTGKVKGGFQGGLGIEYKLRDTYGVEVLYYRQESTANVNGYYGAPIDRSFNAGINYILLGATKYVPKGKAEPFVGFLVGAAIFNNKDAKANDESSVTKFALGGRAGVNVWVSDRVGIKLQVQLMTAVQGFGGGFYFGTGGGGAGVSTYSTITQLGLGGGLMFKVGH